MLLVVAGGAAVGGAVEITRTADATADGADTTVAAEVAATLGLSGRGVGVVSVLLDNVIAVMLTIASSTSAPTIKTPLRCLVGVRGYGGDSQSGAAGGTCLSAVAPPNCKVDASGDIARSGTASGSAQIAIQTASYSSRVL